ncbi:hypothetical protein [Haloterrigena sp. H1]|uniref:hypothetical protein n=1 Tax=Haloterrigena sp. H1 TaxID=2552943 RepID=UPI001486FD6C|nr:hypothetical protein [Haloterrigena sp. H1]
MAETSGPFECDACGETVSLNEARRTKTMGGLDPAKWQTLCCPSCGARLQTIYVGE